MRARIQNSADVGPDFGAVGGAGDLSALVGALLRLGRDEEALAVLTEARSLNPDEESGVVNMAIVLSHRERYREALTVLDEGHARFPDRPATATLLARLLASAPDPALRNGARALRLAMVVYGREPSAAYAETVALALAELGRCDEAADWMRRGIAEATRVKSEADMARLATELPKYTSAACRPRVQ